MGKIKIIGAEGCSHCEKLKSLLNEIDIKYTFIDANDDKHKDLCSEVFNIIGKVSIPIAILGREIIGTGITENINTIEQLFQIIKKFNNK